MHKKTVMLIKLAWRNIWRNRKRTLITLASIVFAVLLSILMDSVKKGLLDQMKENVVGNYTGYIQIHKQNFWDDRSLENSLLATDAAATNVKNFKHVSHVIPRLESFVLAASNRYSKGAMVVGIHPEKELFVTKLDQKIVEGTFLQAGDRAALLSSGLADYLKLSVGDTLILMGQGYHGANAAEIYPIKGIIKFGSPDLNQRLVYLPLKSAQELFAAEERLTAMVISLDRPNHSKLIAAEIQGNLSDEFEVMHWQEMLPELDQFIEGEKRENVIFQIILYLLIAFGVFGTILMMTIERQYEFGIMIAVGMKNLKLARLVFLENILISVVGSFIGIVISAPIVYYLYKFPISLQGELARAYENFGMEPIFYFSIDPVVFYTQGLVVLFLAIVLSMYPIVRIIRLNPIKAMNA